MKRRYWLALIGLGWLWPGGLWANQRGTRRNYYSDMFAFTQQVIHAAKEMADYQLAGLQWGADDPEATKRAELNRMAGELQTLIGEWEAAVQPKK